MVGAALPRPSPHPAHLFPCPRAVPSSRPLQPPKSAIAKGDKVHAAFSLPNLLPFLLRAVQPKRPLGPYFIFAGEMRESVSIHKARQRRTAALHSAIPSA